MMANRAASERSSVAFPSSLCVGLICSSDAENWSLAVVLQFDNQVSIHDVQILYSLRQCYTNSCTCQMN